LPTIQHSVLGSGELHEPKGASGASSNETYVSDGAGSGTWKEPEPKGISSATDGQIYEADGAGSGSWVTAQSTGVEDKTNSGGQLATVSGVPKLLEIDGVGYSYEDFIPSRTSVWDLASNEMDFGAAGWLVGDTAQIRIGFTVVTASNNDNFLFGVDFAVGGVNPFTVQAIDLYEKSPGTHTHSVSFPFFIGSTDVLDFPAQITVTSDNSSNTAKLEAVTVFHYPKILVRT